MLELSYKLHQEAHRLQLENRKRKEENASGQEDNKLPA